ncbi:MAG: hypothetical protein IJV41_06480 [Oscillospiraceae bacterium]|nr:hypothetical protein [Oscillospiraceae bacterium]
MFLTLTKRFGKPVCVALYAVFSALAARKKPLPLLILFVMHLTEYVLVGRKVAAEHGIGQAEAAAQCLSFGFTWWLPIKRDV